MSLNNHCHPKEGMIIEGKLRENGGGENLKEKLEKKSARDWKRTEGED